MRSPYPSYKPSGTEWLGDVPEHWNEMLVKRCYEIQLGKMLQPEPDSSKDFETLYLKAHNVQWGKVFIEEPSMMWANDNDVQQFGVRRGDLLVCEGGEVGRAALLGGMFDDFIIQNALHRVRAKSNCNNGFLMYWLAALASSGWFEANTNKATIAHFTKEKFGALPFSMPPLEEQRVIAAFLDQETARVDALVEKKKQLIERLAEYRTALITQTVTRGLPPDVAEAEGFDPSPCLKPSGVEWLEDLPEHWDVRQLGILGSFFKGGGGTKEDETERGLPCIRYGDLYTQHQFLIRHSRSVISESSTSNYKKLRYGDLLFAGSGETFEEIGKSAVNLIERTAYCGGDVIGFRPHIKINATFLGYAADCSPATYQKACMGRGVTVIHIYGRQLKHLIIPLPPLEEQRAIVSFLDRETERIDALSSRVEGAIERLQEYRTALITAAVTGKIDVSNWERVETGASA